MLMKAWGPVLIDYSIVLLPSSISILNTFSLHF